ncbi:hypothetical protein GCM10010168_75790 [Actinoplanes ianthinogenes]|uniref:ABC3 transporter permease C-terminal domain-containing protein n=1 Tax=Actinoplanes ianthinogenes TaxID=122358 RepID=A0ABM7LRJ2_9ACTN|nr:FtsX-like permease family protein [Actinoplanes ianthinogenes]BCJ41891.1 hypothetical protein Aiant_25480 [Actinoplanes ianthinogenes]GGR45745.1 hypothetical protein GCM10010168_75790 [Actinoplanes ianthinogenes]
MLALVLGAVRTRTAQVLTILALTVVATAIAAAAPWYAAAATARAAEVDLAAAPAAQRMLSIRQGALTGGDAAGALEDFRASVRPLLPMTLDQPVYGLVKPLNVATGPARPVLPAAYREQFCDRVTLDGPCPSRPGEAAISRDAATRLGLAPGDRFSLVDSPGQDTVTLTVVARYTPREPDGPYWSDPLYRKDQGLDPAFTPLSTFAADVLRSPTLTLDGQVPDRLFRGAGGFDLAAELRETDARLAAAKVRLVTTSAGLLVTLHRDRVAIRDGVATAAVQTLVLAWFAIGLAGRYTGRDRRADAALLKLRGTSRLGTLRLVWGQHLVPLLAGALLGAPAGYLLARLLAGPVTDPGDRRSAVLLSLGAVAAVLLGGLLVLAVLEALVLRRPVPDLLRGAGTATAGTWRSGLADLLLVAVAGAAVYQSRTAGADGAGLARAAPVLLALAVALLLARLLTRAADRGGAAWVRGGRLPAGLTALRVSRQPGTDRVVALLVVAVAVFLTATGAWAGERAARDDRSAAESGAPRVLRVQAANRIALLTAVRTADPGGTRAMAVVVDTTSEPRVLSVDSARFAAVAERAPLDVTPPAAGDAGPGLPLVTGDRLTVRVRRDGPAPVQLTLTLRHDGTGVPSVVPFGALRAGEQEVSAPVRGCATAPGCRIVRWTVTAPAARDGTAGPASPGSAVVVRDMAQANPAADLLGPAELGDVTRWRAGADGAALDVSTAGGALRLSPDQNAMHLPSAGAEAWAVDTPLPLPVVLAGPEPDGWRLDDPTITLGGSPMPISVRAHVPAVPVLGRSGVLTDLDALRRLTGDAEPPGEYQVWLAAGAPDSLVAALTAAGLQVSGDGTRADRFDRLGRQGPAAVTRFGLLAGLAALLLAAATCAVAAAVDRRGAGDQLRALRLQGLATRVAVAVGYAGTAAPIVAGLLGGTLAALLTAPLTGTRVLAFTDGWDVLPLPAPLGGIALGLGLLTASALLGLTGWLAVQPLVRRLRAVL